MPDCLFCKIAKREIPSEVIFEDAHSFAFLDISPNNHGHTLVIPKEHSRNIFDISPENFLPIAETARKIARAVKAGVNADGVNIAMNNEPCAGQIIFHTHLLIIPRHQGDGLRVWTKKVPYRDGEMQVVGEKIRREL